MLSDRSPHRLLLTLSDLRTLWYPLYSGGAGEHTETQRGSATGPELHTWKVTHLEGIHSYV